MYLMKLQKDNEEDKQLDEIYADSDKKGGGIPTSRKGPGRVFKNVFEKEFYLSPFSARNGTYSIVAADPFANTVNNEGCRIDILLVLRSSEGRPKVIGRLISEGAPMIASSVSMTSLMHFLSRFWWLGFATLPRIMWQAWQIDTYKKLQVWLKPEIRSTNMPRRATAGERYNSLSFPPRFHMKLLRLSNK